MDMNWYRFLQTLTAIGALLITAGLVALGSGAGDYAEARRMAGWPATPGDVLTSEVYTAEFRGRSLTYAPAVRIEYGYSVGGEAYTGDRVDIPATTVRAGSDEGRRRLQLYPVGAAVTVYHDPADPAEAILERGAPTATLTPALILFVMGGMVLALRWLLRDRLDRGISQ